MDYSFDLPMFISPVKLPMMATLCGGAKMGKTLLACSFPKVILMAWEHAGPTIEGRSDIKTLPKLIESFDEGVALLRFLVKTDHKFETLVIDSVTKMDQVFRGEIIKNDPKKPSGMGDALGGYGKSFLALSELHRQFVSACDFLRKSKNMNIVFVAHSDVGKFSPPDGETYNRYELAMHEDSFKHYVNNSDLIGFIKQKTYVTEGDDGRNKVTSTDQRVLVCYESAAHVSGNRYGIKKDIDLPKGVNVLEKYLNTDRERLGDKINLEEV